MTAVLFDCLLGNFNPDKIVEELKGLGAISFPFLSENLRRLMADLARHLSYLPLKRNVSGGLVQQEADSCRTLSPYSLFSSFANEYEGFLSEQFYSLGSPVFAKPHRINDISIQRYHKGSLGITPHIDGKSRLNLVSVIVLEGQGKFFICQDRSGKDAVQLDGSPGNLILMRANGFMGYENTPFHFVKDIETDRYVFGLRQKKPAI